ncbi:glycosyltransferase family 2 protein [Aminivibrio sp.]|uniref:glycosyltransferase family 2 protein n=1 Tax=Aminivibrio sp. TaxID=1872489 RepID=UPI00345ECF53
MSSLSIYMITLNEEHRLPRTLKALSGVVDEIVLVDCGSKDRTLDIARSHGARVHHRDWDNYSAQKSHAESLCTGDWLMNVDADEEMSPGLGEEIRKAIDGDAYDAFRVRITDVFPGKPRPHPWVKGFNVVRLYRRDCARMGQTLAWDRVGFTRPGVRIGQLKRRIYHHSFVSVSQIVDKYNRYTDQQIETARSVGKRYSPLRMLLAINLNFFRYFILHRQFLNGWWGYINSVNLSYMRFLKFAKYYESSRPREGEEGS